MLLALLWIDDDIGPRKIKVTEKDLIEAIDHLIHGPDHESRLEIEREFQSVHTFELRRFFFLKFFSASWKSHRTQ
jgi:hypothetical protein